MDVITDVAVLHMGTYDIIGSEVHKDLAADSTDNSARECIYLLVQKVYLPQA